MPIVLCKEPGCPFFGRYCRNHTKGQLRPSDSPVEKKQNKPIPKESAQRKQDNKSYRKVQKEIKKRGKCRVNSPNCIGEPVRPHHLERTGVTTRSDIKKVIPCCDPCNLYIEEK